jgi:probable F420-dependent oxidoreductase
VAIAFRRDHQQLFAVTGSEPRFELAPVGVWTSAFDFVPTSRLRELAAELEQLGYGAIWIPEVAGRDVFVTLAHILGATETVVGATGIANIWARDAVAMTGGVKCLTEAYPERVLLGLGVSHQNLVEDLRGHNYEHPLQAMRSYLEAMDGSPYTGERPATPVRRVLAALGPKMLALAAENADGAHPFLVPPSHTAFARETLGERPLLCPEQMVALETDPAKARDVARRGLAVYLGQPNYARNLVRLGFGEEDLAEKGSDRLVDALVAWGPLDAVAARVREHFDAGADHVCVQALSPEKRGVPVGEWRELAPALAEAGRARRPLVG